MNGLTRYFVFVKVHSDENDDSATDSYDDDDGSVHTVTVTMLLGVMT